MTNTSFHLNLVTTKKTFTLSFQEALISRQSIFSFLFFFSFFFSFLFFSFLFFSFFFSRTPIALHKGLRTKTKQDTLIHARTQLALPAY